MVAAVGLGVLLGAAPLASAAGSGSASAPSADAPRSGAHGPAAELVAPAIEGEVDIDLLAEAMPVLKVRAKDTHELAEGAAFLFKRRPLEMTEKAAGLLDDDARKRLSLVSARLKGENNWTLEALEATTKSLAEELELGLGKLAQPLRAALTGTTTSPGIFDVLVLLGREESLARIDAQAA